MSSQVISYRLSTDEVLQLRQKALPGESDNQTAQRLMRETLGLYTVSTVIPSLSIDSLDNRIESILEERLSSFASNQNNKLLTCLQERLQEIEAQVKKLPASNLADVDRLQTDIDRLQKERDQLDARNLELEAADGDLRNDLLMKDEEIAHLKEELGKLVIAPQPTTYDQELLTQAELAQRLGCDSGTLTKNRKKLSFEEWSQSKDPQGKAWRYLPNTQRYGLVQADVLSTRNLAKAQGSCLDCYLLGIWNLQINLDSGRQLNHQIRVSRRDQDLFGTYNNNIGGRFDLRSYSNGDRGRPVVTIALRPLVQLQGPLVQDAKQTYRAVMSGIAQTDMLINGRFVDVDGNQGTATLTKQ